MKKSLEIDYTNNDGKKYESGSKTLVSCGYLTYNNSIQAYLSSRLALLAVTFYETFCFHATYSVACCSIQIRVDLHHF
jgi:hypothetical protein